MDDTPPHISSATPRVPTQACRDAAHLAARAQLSARLTPPAARLRGTRAERFAHLKRSYD